VGDGTELALGTKITISISVCDLLVLGQGSQVSVGLSDGCQKIQCLLAGAAARVSELIVGVRLDLNGFTLVKWQKHDLSVATGCAGWAVNVGGGGGRVEHCFAVVDDEGVQALAVNHVVAMACDTAGNCGVGLQSNVIKAQDASVAGRRQTRLDHWSKSKVGRDEVAGTRPNVCEQIESELVTESVVEERRVELLPGGAGG
jgi:hypothetical protein